MYKVVFSDIDGTLLNHKYQLSPPTVEAIRKLHLGGIPFILVSARGPKCIFPIQEEIGIGGPVISYGGALILDGERRPVHSLGININRAIALKKQALEKCPRVAVTMYSHDEWFVDDAADPRVMSEAANTGAIPLEVPVEELPGRVDEVHKIFCIGDPEDIVELDKTLATLNTDLLVIRSSPIFVEVMNGEVSKADAINRVGEAMGIIMAEAVAFGDNYNDIDMLETAGLGIAMGNSPEPVKQRADRVTADCDRDGVMLALESLSFSPIGHCTSFIQ